MKRFVVWLDERPKDGWKTWLGRMCGANYGNGVGVGDPTEDVSDPYDYLFPVHAEVPTVTDENEDGIPTVEFERYEDLTEIVVGETGKGYFIKFPSLGEVVEDIELVRQDFDLAAEDAKDA